MSLSTQQRAALHELTTSGLLSAEQEQVVCAALDGRAKTGGTRHLLVELIGYLGGGLLLGGAVLLVGTSWEDLSRLGHVLLLGGATAALIVAGLLIAGGPVAVRRLEHQRRRIVSALFALSSATAAFTAGVAVDDHEFPIGSAVGLLVAIAGYTVLPTVVGHVAVVATAVAATGGWTSEFISDTPLAVGIALFVAGVLGMGLALANVLQPVTLGLALGAAVAVFGAQQPLAGSDTATVTYALTAALALACFAAYLRWKTVVLLVAGVVAATIAVPEMVWDWTDGAVGGGALLLVAGAVLLATSGASIRLRRER